MVIDVGPLLRGEAHKIDIDYMLTPETLWGVEFGSDAHVSRRIGSYYDEVTDYLRSKGIRYLIYFNKRVAHQYGI